MAIRESQFGTAKSISGLSPVVLDALAHGPLFDCSLACHMHLHERDLQQPVAEDPHGVV